MREMKNNQKYYCAFKKRVLIYSQQMKHARKHTNKTIKHAKEQKGKSRRMQDMKYVEFDQTRPMDLILLGRVAIDFNPAYNDQVKEEFKPLKDVHTFEKFVGGSPANIAVGVTRHGLKAGFLGKVSDDQFGDYVTEYFDKQGIDTSHITRCTNGEKLGLTFTEMLSEKESHILMYRNCIADLQLHVDDIDEDYIKQSKAILISGTALAESPSREAAIKAVMLAKKNDTWTL